MNASEVWQGFRPFWGWLADPQLDKIMVERLSLSYLANMLEKLYMMSPICICSVILKNVCTTQLHMQKITTLENIMVRWHKDREKSGPTNSKGQIHFERTHWLQVWGLGCLPLLPLRGVYLWSQVLGLKSKKKRSFFRVIMRPFLRNKCVCL